MSSVDNESSELYRGTVFRIKGEYPFREEYVDFMLCDYPNCSEIKSPFALYCIFGYCAGEIEYVFPLEAMSESSRSIRREWILENWNKRIFDKCDIDDVEIII